MKHLEVDIELATQEQQLRAEHQRTAEDPAPSTATEER